VKPQQDLQSKAVSELRPGQEAQHGGRVPSAPATAREASGAGMMRLATRVSRSVLQVVLPGLVLAGALAAFSYMKATRPEIAKRKIRETVFTVRSVPVRYRSVVPMLTLYGTTIAGRKVDLRSLVAGRVLETGPGLRDGGEVKIGETLLRIDPFDFEVRLREVRAQLAEAEAKLAEMKASLSAEENNLAFAREQLKLGRTDLERATPLARRGAVSARTVDDRRLIVVQRQQAVKRSADTIAVWHARIAQQEAAIVRLKTTITQSERRLEETVLAAPFNAYVANIEARVGRLLSVNDRVATLIDRDWIDVRFSLSNAQFGRLIGGAETLIGRRADVAWNVGSRTLKYRATVERIGAQVTSTTGGVEVFARIESPTSPVPIRPGVFVEVTLPDARFDKIVVVPSTAVYDNARVYVIQHGRLQARAITVKGVAGGDLLITGALKDGDRVLSSRLSTPGDGVRVEEQVRHGNGA
jgi:membrane fusion protein, multidrug efflux system